MSQSRQRGGSVRGAARQQNNLEATYARFATVGQTADAQLAWLSRFVELDLGRVEASDIQGQLAALVTLADFRNSAASPGRRSQPISAQEPWTMDQVASIQTRVRKGLNGLAGDGWWWRVEGPPLRAVAWHHKGDPRNWDVTTAWHGTNVQRALAAIVDLLVAAGPSLRNCAGCGRWFAAGRVTQQQCSTRCTNRMTAARYRERHADTISERKHGSYAKRVSAAKPEQRLAIGRRKPKPKTKTPASS